ncbi:unnamed protein product [Acanthosepion pharaonis]|uniref:Uncharacterized protein n=1 Tax=Acanthosepion pharaonis TaxID=158019 RepID=A0A812AZM1_ACAPH|nr:unnamed protein product [Sepia pharaonis]
MYFYFIQFISFYFFILFSTFIITVLLFCRASIFFSFSFSFFFFFLVWDFSSVSCVAFFSLFSFLFSLPFLSPLTIRPHHTHFQTYFFDILYYVRLFPVRLSVTLLLFYPPQPLFLFPLLSFLYLSALSTHDIPIISATIFSTFVRTSFYMFFLHLFSNSSVPFFFKALMMVGVRSAPHSHRPRKKNRSVYPFTPFTRPQPSHVGLADRTSARTSAEGERMT